MQDSQPKSKPRRSVIHRLAGVLVKVLLTILIILVLVVFLVQTPYVQNIIRSKAETYLSRKLKTRVAIGNLYIKFPQDIVLKNIYLEDRQKDTLLSAGLIDVHIRMWGLLHHSVDIPAIQLTDLTVKVKRQLPDTLFNFRFIADAFSSAPDVTKATKPATPMTFSVGSLTMDKIRLVYKDVVTGNDVEAWIGHSRTDMGLIDPTAMHFNVKKFNVNGLQARIRQDQPLAGPAIVVAGPVATSANPAAAQTASSLQLQLGTIDLAHSQIEYLNTINALYTNWQIAKLAVRVKTFDMDHQVIGLDALTMDSANAVVRMGPATATGKVPPSRGRNLKPPAPVAADTSAGWHFMATSVQLNGNNIQFDDNGQPRQRKGMDYAHLKMTGLTLHAADLSYNKDSVSGQLTKGAFKEKSGFELDELHTAFLYTDKKTLLKGLLLRTPGTLLQRNVSLQYASLDRMMKDPAHTLIDLDMPDSRIAVKDILTFVPSLASQPALKAGDVWKVNAKVNGNLDALHVQTLHFSGIQDLQLDLAGTVLHPMDTRRVAGDFEIRNFSGSRTALLALLPKGVLPANINLPARFDLHGKLNGGMAGIHSDITLHTSSGTVVLKGSILQFSDPKKATYDLALKTKSLDLGYILKDPRQWGLVTADFTAKGRGFYPQTADAKLHGLIYSATIRKYNYTGFLFDGSLANKHLELTSSIQNTAVSFNLKASGDLANKFPALKLDWQIDTLDLHALHLVTDTLQFSGHIGADFASTNPDSLQGQLKISQVVLVSGLQKLNTDSITLTADRKDDIQDIQFHSEMADLDWRGRYKVTETGLALQHMINQYYRQNGFRDTAFTAQDWQMEWHLRPSPLVLSLMPSLKGTDTAMALVAFNSEKNDLRIDLTDPHIQFGTQTFGKTEFTASTTGFSGIPARAQSSASSRTPHTTRSADSSRTSNRSSAADSSRALNYLVQIAEGSGSGFQLHQTSLQGYLSNNKLFASLLLKDSKQKDRYRVAGMLDKLADGLKFALNPDSLLLNYDQWQVSRDNFFLYDSAGVVINDFKISNSDQSLSVTSNPPEASSPVDVAFANFHLNTLSRFADQDSLLVDGILNGKAEIKNLMSSPVFTSDLSIKALSYKADTVGDLTLKVNNETANAFDADIALTGNKNDVEVKGMYYTGEGKMDLKLDLKQLNLASVKPFASAQVEDLRGFLKGALKIQGTMDEPKIAGSLHFDSTLITPVITGEPLRLSKDNIEFDADGFNFSQFSMQDSAGNKATIDGNVFTTNYRDYRFDVSVNASNFRLVNAPESNTRLFYGKMNLDVASNLTGDMNAPKIDGDIRINKKTNFIFVLPGSDPELASREGVVRFMDHHNPGDTLVLKHMEPVKEIVLKGVDVALNIQTDSSAIFTMVIDERNGDALTVRGRSNLVFGMDPKGRIELTGGYEVESGAYNLSFNLLKRKFEIQRGSTITWTGDIMKATVDITAAYTANTSSLDLIANEIAGRSQTDINKFKQKLPFLVTLKMAGDLLQPKITFDITLPPNVLTLWPDVDAKLQQVRVQESELNKQVFALLLLNRFVGENPLESAAGGGSTVGNLAFQSASQILTNQLDQLAGSLIKGVNIHFDLNNEQDFSTGKENDYTELNVTVSKTLFNERVTVNVGSNFDVQGTSSQNQQASNLAGDVAVDYKLTQDGRYMLRAYRKNQYQAVVEGQVVESGVSFILTFDYNRFREIFGKTKAEKLEERRVSRPQPTPSSDIPPAKQSNKPAQQTTKPEQQTTKPEPQPNK